MASDKARVTFDEARRYRSVVMQQGRVTLEADWNEQAQIDDEELRHDLRDIIGPYGTPDNGFAIGVANNNITIGHGTMYVGGLRAFLPERADKTPYPFSPQPDWTLPDQAQRPPRELIYLELTEQEISAVEDKALLEPALGGPDTAQRLRIMQRVRRTATSADNCVDAWSDFLSTKEFDPDQMMFTSRSRLQVGFSGQGLKPDPCDPAADPGYLGAENQLIRVAIAAPAANATQQRVLWGYDNASFLYRVTSYDATAKTLILASRPVDDAHKPRSGQVIELLRGVASLGDGNIAAEPFGKLAVLAQDYSADDKMLTLTDVLPNGYAPTNTMPLYVRVWEAAIPFTANTPVTLGSTGIEVTLTTSGITTFQVGEFWTFAVRPSTPAEVLPIRYKNAPQPPEGFRRWACPLAVINWTITSGINQVSDCREHFDDLVTLSKRRGSCCIVVRPEDLAKRTLQQIIDTYSGANKPAEFCLVAGDYILPAPLMLRHPLTIVGCGPGVRIRAAEANLKDFRAGLIQIVSGSEITLQNLELHLPPVPWIMGGEAEQRDIDGCIGIRIIDAQRCTIEECTFKYPLTPPKPPAPPTPPAPPSLSTPAPAAATPAGRASLSAGILAHGILGTLHIRRNTFEGATDLLRAPFGVVCLPAIYRKPGGKFGAHGSIIMDLTIEQNQFVLCHTAVLVWGDLAEILVRENLCILCINGILLFARRWWAALAFVDHDEIKKLQKQMEDAVKPSTAAPFTAYRFISSLVFHPAILIPTAAFSALELPAPFKGTGPDLAEGNNRGQQAFLSIVAAHAADTLDGPMSPPPADIIKTLEQSWKELPAPFRGLVSPDLRKLSLLDVFEPQPLFFSTIDVSHNQVTRPTPVFDPPLGVSFLYVTDDRNTSGRVIVSGNDWSGFSPVIPTALMLFPFRSTVTGNIIQNDYFVNPELTSPSLILVPVPQPQAGNRPAAIITAVTGNDFVGMPILPKRISYAPPGATLPAWFLLNTVVS
ncbi:MAG TPA: DUF6519 domain-containing protein [Thermoanaerobaculia bacterium]